MKNFNITAKYICTPLMLALILVTLPATGAKKDDDTQQQHKLVLDSPVSSEHTDINVINAWGLTFNPFTYAWVTDKGASVATLYNGDVAQPLAVSIPAPGNPDGGGAPTGIVFNDSTDFVLPNGSGATPSRFIFATEDGIIAGWAPTTADPSKAIGIIDNSARNAVYKAIAISSADNGNRLYAADFHNNKIDVYDNTFSPASLPAGAFTDPTLPAGFAPFGLQAINGDIYVAYAKQDANKHDVVKGNGLGIINVFASNGSLIRRFESTNKLNAPWGMALAPASFGKLAGLLLVGNSGDNRINAFDVKNGKYIDQLKLSDNNAFQIEGLKGIAFGSGFKNQAIGRLFFAAGPGKTSGLYSRIDVSLKTPELAMR